MKNGYYFKRWYSPLLLYSAILLFSSIFMHNILTAVASTIGIIICIICIQIVGYAVYWIKKYIRKKKGIMPNTELTVTIRMELPEKDIEQAKSTIFFSTRDINKQYHEKDVKIKEVSFIESKRTKP